jgi:hypothetical protein
VWAPLIFLAIDGVLDGSPRSSLLGIAAVAMQILAVTSNTRFIPESLRDCMRSCLARGGWPRATLALLAIYAGGASAGAALTGLH